MDITFGLLLTTLLTAIFTDNFVLVKFLGVCPFLGVSGRMKPAVGMGVSVTIVMVISTAITWPVYHLLLAPNYTYLQTVVFILIIAGIVWAMEVVMKKYFRSLHETLGGYLPLITTNCLVLGVTVINISTDIKWVQAMFNALGGGLGFLMAMVMFAGVRGKMDEVSSPSKSFKGLPITLVAAGIVSLVLSGFGGVFEKLLGG